MIDVANLRKDFGSFAAVDDVSFRVEPGEIFGLLGPNGAGKTTTLRMVTTILKPTSGSIHIHGCDAVNEPERVRHQFGVLSEATGLYDRLTAEENVRYFAQLRDMAKSETRQRIDEIFPMLGIDDYADRKAGKLSKGMKQKVAMAISLLHDPPVLIFDEPTSGLDVMSSRQVRDFLDGFRQTDKTVLLSTHLMPEAERLCDRIAIINDGRIVAVGTPDELRNQSGEDDLEAVFVKLVEEVPQ
ncbi:MAG: ABC transporter ATP-binding protein [Candidatus Bipolaricaulia bacterium]